MQGIIIFYIIIMGPLCLLCGPAAILTWIFFPILPFIIYHFFGDHKKYEDMTWEEKREYEYQKEYKACIKIGIGYIKADEVARQKAEKLVPDPNVPSEPDLSVPMYYYWDNVNGEKIWRKTYKPPKGNGKVWYAYAEKESKIEYGRMRHYFYDQPRTGGPMDMFENMYDQYQKILIRASFDYKAAEKEFCLDKMRSALKDPRFFPKQLIELDEI